MEIKTKGKAFVRNVRHLNTGEKIVHLYAAMTYDIPKQTPKSTQYLHLSPRLRRPISDKLQA